MSDEMNTDRRRFLGTAMMAMAVGVMREGGRGKGEAGRGKRDGGSGKTERLNAEVVITSRTSFDSLKQIDAGVLNVGYAESGPATGPAVVLLHGWPYDIHAFVDVAPLLAAKGYRVIVPYLRGYGTTRFLSDETVRNGEQAVIAVD
ncbi:MAG: alpha/beta fold hydrolase, partial [Gemmatimonadaceae bacterium]